ncbi:hypothetical protein AB0N05_37880 [Nocardia sp. NPDC051030]|uniref:hypothetical protein n=1 Tax=Nocardia sp. NPDC051030 TaxID=3155162 RepID=UPI003418CA1C
MNKRKRAGSARKPADFVTALEQLVQATHAATVAQLAQIGWAMDEIDQAQQRHPGAANALFHSFGLLGPTSERMSMEFVFRSHCAELLERVAADVPTQPGTAVEVVLACRAVSLIVPQNTTAVGLYMRMWCAAFPDKADIVGTGLEHYEALRSSSIDDFERLARTKLAVQGRVLQNIECHGRHYDVEVECEFATPRSTGAGAA